MLLFIFISTHVSIIAVFKLNGCINSLLKQLMLYIIIKTAGHI